MAQANGNEAFKALVRHHREGSSDHSMVTLRLGGKLQLFRLKDSTEDDGTALSLSKTPFCSSSSFLREGSFRSAS